MKRPVITFNEADHTYTVDGASVPSVTTIITRLLGSGFEHIKDPEYYKQRGRALHACAALLAAGEDYDTPAGLEGHDQALRRAWKDLRPDPVYWEKPVGSALYQAAGTLDLCARLMGKPELILVDYKSSLSEHRTFIQLGGYSLLLKDTTGEEVKRGIGVWLRGDGTYRVTKPMDLRLARQKFIALRSAYADWIVANKEKGEVE